jgi:hypothetical protein
MRRPSGVANMVPMVRRNHGPEVERAWPVIHNVFLYLYFAFILLYLQAPRKWTDSLKLARGRRGICTGFWWESPKERDHSEDQVVDGRMGSEGILRRLAGGIEWIQLAQEGADVCFL